MKDAYLKMNPPLRTKKDVAGLWNALRDGQLDIVTSEHAPGTREEKSKCIWDSWGGVPGIETMIPVLYTPGVLKKRLSLQRMVDVACSSPSKIFGLDHCKGAIKIGMDADIVVLDTKTRRRVRAEELHSKCGWTQFEGKIMSGFPKATVLRGNVLQEDGMLQDDARRSSGKFVRMVK
jgi:dihydroorotase-like cyclic amidohydrolase